EIADSRAGGGVDPDRQELLEAVAAVVEDAERRVPRAGEVPRGLEDGLEHRLEVEVRDERAPDLDQAAQMRLSEPLADVRSGQFAHGRPMLPALRGASVEVRIIEREIRACRGAGPALP